MMRQRRDEEVNEIAEEAYRGAHRLLSDHRDLLDEIARKLLVDEVIEQTEIAAIMARHEISVAEPRAVPATRSRTAPRPGRQRRRGRSRAHERGRRASSRRLDAATRGRA